MGKDEKGGSEGHDLDGVVHVGVVVEILALEGYLLR